MGPSSTKNDLKLRRAYQSPHRDENEPRLRYEEGGTALHFERPPSYGGACAGVLYYQTRPKASSGSDVSANQMAWAGIVRDKADPDRESHRDSE